MPDNETAELIELVASEALNVLKVAANRIAADPILAKSVEVDGVNETTIAVTISLPQGVEPNTSTATTLNAIALRVISQLSSPTEEDVECSLSGCLMRPLKTLESEKIVLPLKVTFSIPQQESK